MVVNGSLALLGPHYFTGTLGDGTPASGDSFVPNYVSQINNLMGDESLTLVPEPSTLLLLGAGLLAVGLRRRRRRAA